jgi:hypothetical protein
MSSGSQRLFPPASGFLPNADRQAKCDLIKPAAQCFALANRRRPLRENQKRSLKNILGIVLVPQNPPARRQHHGSVPAHQFGESKFVTPINIAVEQFTVRKRRRILDDNAPHQADDVVQGRRFHARSRMRDFPFVIVLEARQRQSTAGLSRILHRHRIGRGITFSTPHASDPG